MACLKVSFGILGAVVGGPFIFVLVALSLNLLFGTIVFALHPIVVVGFTVVCVAGGAGAGVQVVEKWETEQEEKKLRKAQLEELENRNKQRRRGRARSR